jgi:hypothetical protein
MKMTRIRSGQKYQYIFVTAAPNLFLYGGGNQARMAVRMGTADQIKGDDS